ncbi:uncharacterized protein LOC115449978 [Manduca sexta]|uniref:Uncharacterized protein n=1 Tax=Manduca sexta TaxID=7130 RepID=A0A921ZLS5_MANSE|nr:uncharacterized protein LOC115449978 [Manduca sexta]KAG6460140.1 hypothetical protein O3G_MSEX011796 [Manduca sexta]
MRNTLLILGCFVAATALTSAYSVKKDCGKHDSRNRLIANIIKVIQQKETALFQYFYRKHASKSISVTGVLEFIAKTLHALYKPHDAARTLKTLGLDNIEQAIEITRFIVDEIEKCSNVHQKYEVYADRSNRFRNSYKNNLADVCRGETKYIDYNNDREVDYYINKWFSSPENQDGRVRNRCFKRNGIVFSASFNLIASFDNNVDNTLRNTHVNYRFKNGAVSRMPALSGIFEVLYFEDKKINAQFIQISINKGDGHVIYGLPQNRKDLPLVIEKLSNETQRNILIKSMKRMNVEITSIIGAAFMKNGMEQYFISQGITLNGYTNVLQGSTANVNAIVQNINITLQEVKPQSPYPSSHLQGRNKCRTKFIINSAVVYKIALTKYNIPYGFGLYDFAKHGEFN